MINATLRFAISGLVLVAGPQASMGYGQAPPAATQQSGIWESGSANPSQSSSIDSAPAAAAPTSSNNTGASSWSAGHSSFGAQRTIPRSSLDSGTRKESSAAPPSGSSSWTAGRGNFGLNVQQNGIWRAPSGVTRIPRGASSARVANGLRTQFASPNSMGRPPVASASTGTPIPRAVAPHSLPGARGNEMRPGTSGRPFKTPRESISGRAGSKSLPRAPRGRTYQPGRNRSTIGSGQKIFQPEATGQMPFSGPADGTSAAPQH